jgi:hypothetical protein
MGKYRAFSIASQKKSETCLKTGERASRLDFWQLSDCDGGRVSRDVSARFRRVSVYGISGHDFVFGSERPKHWVPAFAGMSG